MVRSPLRAVLLPLTLVLLALITATAARAQDRAGEFDHYILALTWIPAFCELTGDAREDARCAAGSAHGWMVHGLWPQHAGGAWPEFCRTPHRNPSRQETARQTDLFGAAGAAWHQWNKHGRCTGLSAADYFALTRAARDRLVLPEVFGAIARDLVVAPEVIEAAFIEANDGFDSSMMLTTCRGNAVYELRLCLTRELDSRPCDPATLLRACALDAARLPALR